MEIFDIFTGAKPQEKSLNCPFQFGGQNYDAYEVLGVPAGAPKELCFGAFRDQCRSSDSDKKKLFEAAIKALEKHRFS